MPFQILGFTEKIPTHARSRALLMGNTLPRCLLLTRLGEGFAHAHATLRVSQAAFLVVSCSGNHTVYSRI